MDAELAPLNTELASMYTRTGRTSVAPERLLKASLLMALYSVRSDRLFCQTLEYNLLFRWFLDMGLESRSFDHSTFSKNRERLMEHDIAKRFFTSVVQEARTRALLLDEHFTADGTLIEAWASFKSFKPKDDLPPPSGSDGSGMVDFKGERHSNTTHESSSGPQAKLMRKGNGQPAKLSYGAHALIENRHGLLVDRRRFARERLTTLGTGKGYHNKGCVELLRQRHIRPHIAHIEERSTPGLDDRTTRHHSYRISQRKRKRIEEIFGWMKTIGGLCKSRFIGQARTQPAAYLVSAAYNLMRMANLSRQPG